MQKFSLAVKIYIFKTHDRRDKKTNTETLFLQTLHLYIGLLPFVILSVCPPGEGRPSWSGAEDAGSRQDGLSNLKRSGSFTKLRESIRRSSEKLVRKLKGVGVEETTQRSVG